MRVSFLILMVEFLLGQGWCHKDYAGHYSFENKGKLASVVEMAHLVIPVDFRELKQQLDTFCEAITNYRILMREKEGTYMLSYTAKRLAFAGESKCENMKDDFQTIESLWANTNTKPLSTQVSIAHENRRPRQLAVITFGVLSVLTCFSQLYSRAQMFSLLKETNEHSNEAIMKLHGLETNVALNANNIAILNQTVHVFREMLQDSIVSLTDVQSGMSFHVLLNTLDTQISRILSGLAMLSQHKLSPLIVRPLYMVEPLQRLQSRLLKRNLIVSLNNVSELFFLCFRAPCDNLVPRVK